MVGDPREGKIRLRVEPLSFAVSISEYIADARGPPASEPIKRQFWWPMAKGALGCIVVEAQAADLEAAGQRGPPRPHIPESRCKLGFAREPARGFLGPRSNARAMLRLRPRNAAPGKGA